MYIYTRKKEQNFLPPSINSLSSRGVVREWFDRRTGAKAHRKGVLVVIFLRVTSARIRG